MATKAIAKRRSRTVVVVKRATRRASKMTVPLAIVAGVAPTLMFAYDGFKIGGSEGGVGEAAHRLTMRLTGYEWKGGVWSFGELTKGWAPILAGVVAHKMANRFGVNRMIASAGIPLIRI